MTVESGIREAGRLCVEPGLSDAMRAVAAFHTAFDLPRQPVPSTDVSTELAQLRVDLLVEEVGEFADATSKRDLTAMADALGDIIYVAYGAAVTYGIDLDAVLMEIHRSNMSKLGSDGRPVLRQDGKVLKSSSYRPPDVARVLAEQSELTVVSEAIDHP
ncbi:MazG nucleotide pyrophosphohydrolase [Catenulispora acidiphila DSM 44928]|uniref:MazG nucleotide pyrophosphohydrolase n=2 Tax=Catenulispora TaxID=414878 RepID=C7PX95_CATAD|nr:MazG nucleotide pyrophosphohydrolase [Catenulispora acidiphila DSM 44928]